jgi:hypothetical protein
MLPPGANSLFRSRRVARSAVVEGRAAGLLEESFRGERQTARRRRILTVEDDPSMMQRFRILVVLNVAYPAAMAPHA